MQEVWEYEQHWARSTDLLNLYRDERFALKSYGQSGWECFAVNHHQDETSWISILYLKRRSSP